MNRFALILAFALVPACSSSNPGGDGGTGGAGGAGGAGGTGGSTSTDEYAAVRAAMVGDWKNSCTDMGNGTYSQATFHIDAARWGVDFVVNGDAACGFALGVMHIEGPYEITGTSAKVSGAHEGTFSFDKRTITAKVQAFADTVNSMPGCGDGKFQVDVTQDVFTTGCIPMGSYPKADCPREYDLVEVDATKLQFGLRPADNNMCTEAKRPTELNPNAFIKQ